MGRVRLVIAALGVGAFSVSALAACGDDPVGSQLAPVTAPGDVIVVTPDSNLARQLAGDPDAPPPIELTLADGVTMPATTATLAWTAGAGEPSADVVQALAVALDADGEVARDAAGAWTVGTSPGDSVGLLAGGYLGDSFIYTSAARWEQFAANPCDDPPSSCPGPIGVPDQAAALTAAQRVLDALGIERESVEVATDVRTDGMGVTVRSLIDGLLTQGEPDVELLVGSDGSILQAGGRTSVADQSRTVDLIDAGTAAARAERSISAGPFPTRPPIAELPATTSLVPTQPTTPPPSYASGNSGVPVTVYPTVDTVTGFGVGHELVWDVDGRRWIVPTFTVSTASNMLFTVFAIDADMVRVVDAPIGDRDDVGLWGGGSPGSASPNSPAPTVPHRPPHRWRPACRSLHRAIATTDHAADRPGRGRPRSCPVPGRHRPISRLRLSLRRFRAPSTVGPATSGVPRWSVRSLRSSSGCRQPRRRCCSSRPAGPSGSATPAVRRPRSHPTCGGTGSCWSTTATAASPTSCSSDGLLLTFVSGFRWDGSPEIGHKPSSSSGVVRPSLDARHRPTASATAVGTDSSSAVARG